MKLSFVVAGAMFLGTLNACADTIFSNISNAPCPYEATCDQAVSGKFGTVAVAFTPAQNYTFTGASMVLDASPVPMQNPPGTGSPAATPSSTSTQVGVSLAYAASPSYMGLPNTQLLNLGTLNVAGYGDYGVDASSPINLIAGQQYWLTLQALGSNGFYWDSLGSSATPYGQGTAPTSFFYSGTKSLEFSVSGNPVANATTPSSVTPEPASLALLGTGVLAFAGRLKRRRVA